MTLETCKKLLAAYIANGNKKAQLNMELNISVNRKIAKEEPKKKLTKK